MKDNSIFSEKNPPKILLIEDDSSTRLLIRRIISKAVPNTEFFESESFQPVLEILSANTVDCIILDYFLSDADGLEVLKVLRDQDVRIPVIVLTNQTDDVIAAKLIKAGANDYFSKTILQEKNVELILKRSISHAIEKYRLKIESRQARQALELRERRYRGLIENSPILIMRFFNDEDKMITFVNDGFCRYYEINRYEILGEGITTIINRDDTDEFFKKLSWISVENPVLSFEQKGFGKKIDNWQFWTIEGIFDDEGDVIEYQCMGEDITDLKNTQHQLQDSLEEVEKLKILQDGDYFLTSLLLEPFVYDKSENSLLEIDLLVKQKKEFSFKKWNKALGGDLSLAHSIPLSGKRYTFFTNADAMGKSMQGAGGAIVYGAVLQSIINRVRFSSLEQDTYPEMWLRETLFELQGVFESFDGSMLISAVIGLIDDETGFTCFINAEHPAPVLLRNGKATFIHSNDELRKIGVFQELDDLLVNTIQLEENDIMILGSDGRDDLLLYSDKKINEDEKLFLSNVEKGKGKLKELLEVIESHGQLTDDTSFLSISKKEKPDQKPVKMSEKEIKKELAEIKKLKSNNEIMSQVAALSASFQENPELLKAILKFLETKKLHNEALLYFLVYCEINPGDKEMMHQACTCFKESGQLDKARLFLERLVLRSPDNIDYLADLAQLQFDSRNYLEADKLLDRILKIDSSNKWALSMKGEL